MTEFEIFDGWGGGLKLSTCKAQLEIIGLSKKFNSKKSCSRGGAQSLAGTGFLRRAIGNGGDHSHLLKKEIWRIPQRVRSVSMTIW